MDLRGAHLLEPKATSDSLLIPNRPIEDYVRDWAKEFEKEQEEHRRKMRELYRYKMTGPANNYDQLVNWASQYQTASSNIATAITSCGPLPDFTMPAGVPPGTVLRVTAMGQYVVSGSATNLTGQLMWSGTGGTSLFTTGAIALSTSATMNYHVESVIRFIDATHVMVFTEYHGISTTANAGVMTSVRSASIAITTNANETLQFTTTQSVALTSFNVDTFLIEQLN